MLYLVPTPIGNLKDITVRALEVLKAVDGILCEDTRRTRFLLAHYQIEMKEKTIPSLLSFHEHSGRQRLGQMIDLLKDGKSLALVSDSGTPLISDPGFTLVREAIRNNIRVEALPGASAAVTALVASGLASESFSFFGFLPAKSMARRRKLQTLAERQETLIFYESPFRLVKTLQDMKEIFGDREAVAARELTKKFEEISRARLSALMERFSKRKVLGEIVVLVAGKGRKEVFGSPPTRESGN